MAELLGRVERIASSGTGQQAQIAGQVNPTCEENHLIRVLLQGWIESSDGCCSYSRHQSSDQFQHGHVANDSKLRVSDRTPSSSLEISRNLFRQALTDLQQKVNLIQTSINNPRPAGLPQPAVGANLDGGTLNEVRETVRLIKSETNTLLQKAVRTDRW